jgi:3-hydroxyisobutyrate dehydrogenase-like beta-hydroxyacid dehydrogenase
MMKTFTNLAARRILFVGLGQIGAHLATHLKTDGADIVVSNRTLSKAVTWAEQTGGRYTEKLTSALSDRDVVITCVGNDKDLAAVFTGDFVAGLRPGTLVIDHTTASAEGARSLAQKIKERKATFVDAPVSGGSAGAAARKLSIMVGADDEKIFDSARTLMSSYAARILHVGPVGSGQICKMSNQLCIAGALEGVAEGLGLAIHAGLDPRVVVSALIGGAAQSWQLENRSSFMIQRSFVAGFAAKLMAKDLGLAISEAQRLGIKTPVAQVVSEQYKELLARKLGDEDFSNLFRLIGD